MITGMAHVCFTVADLERSVTFYCDTLGLKPAFEFLNEQGRRYGQYIHVGERNFVELFEGQLGELADDQPFRHICLEVDDIEGTVATLRARGLEVTDVKLGKDNSYQAWISDPDGNRIELHGYTPQSLQGEWFSPEE